MPVSQKPKSRSRAWLYQVTVFGLTAASLVQMAVVILPAHFAANSVLYRAHLLAYLVETTLLLLHYNRACAVAPGFAVPDQFGRNVAICGKCKGVRPPRAHHCHACDKCVLRYDHHCWWTNNCVGQYNHKFFYFFLLFTAVVSFHFVALVVPLALHAFKVGVLTPGLFIVAVFVTGCSPLAVGCTALLLAHTLMIAQNRTTVEVQSKDNEEGADATYDADDDSDGPRPVGAGIQRRADLDDLPTRTVRPWLPAWVPLPQWCEPLALILPLRRRHAPSKFDLGTMGNFKSVLGPNIALWVLPTAPFADGSSTAPTSPS